MALRFINPKRFIIRFHLKYWTMPLECNDRCTKQNLNSPLSYQHEVDWWSFFWKNEWKHPSKSKLLKLFQTICVLNAWRALFLIGQINIKYKSISLLLISYTFILARFCLLYNFWWLVNRSRFSEFFLQSDWTWSFVIFFEETIF